MIADVAFDVPVPHPFSYRVPPGWVLAPGQRVLAPLRGAKRVGLVLALRDGGGADLKPLLQIVDASPVLSAAQLELVRWIARESLSSVGSTCAALLPPPLPDAVRRGWRGERPPRTAGGRDPRQDPRMASGRWGGRGAARLELLIGAGREERLLETIGTAGADALVLTHDVETAARWAARLGALGGVVRLDSGAREGERARGWAALARGAARLAVGTRSALLAPLPSPAIVAVVDEHDAAHKPPGAPRIHSRDVVLERAARDGCRAIFTTATPSVEMWWRAESGRVALVAGPSGPWPTVTIADTRGILRREAATPALVRAIRETLAAGQRALLVLSRFASSLACDECGAVVRCERCAIALSWSRARGTLDCRVCGGSAPAAETCRQCHGRRLSPFGWGAERVEHEVRRRFPQARVARYDPEATRGARGTAQRTAADVAEIVIGTRGALRLFGPAALGLAAFVSPDQLLRLPDFRATERAFALMWAAAERVRPDGRLIVQSQTPAHYAFAALTEQSLPLFYKHELKFRAELGYPPFRRLAIVTVRAAKGGDTPRVAEAVAAALRGSARLTVYPPAPDRRDRLRRVVVKGDGELPSLLATALEGLPASPSRSRGIIDVEVDPVEWPF
ncbi:MAG: primosomal protein N' [Candidatus Rokubacteria bacterium]|nr:primosomal protein N' [Candidatus Rokubacteria bacterium]